MNKPNKIFRVAFLLVIYLQAVGAITQASLFSWSQSSEQSSSEVFRPLMVKHTFVHPQNQNSFLPGWIQKSTSDIQPFLGYWPMVVAIGQWVKTAYSQFLNIAGDIAWNSRKTMFIYPFHTFW